MSTTTFDTHRFATRLKDAGLNEKQAEAMIDAFKELSDGTEIATKRDLALLGAEIRRDQSEMKYDLLKWIIGLALTQLAFLVGVMIRLPN